MKKLRTWIYCFLVIMFLLWIFAPGEKHMGSSFSPAPDGTKAFYETLSELEQPVQRWYQPFEELEKQNAHGTLLLVFPTELPKAVSRLDPVLDWVKKGNRLIYFAGVWDNGKDFRQLLGIKDWAGDPNVTKLLQGAPEEVSLTCPQELASSVCEDVNTISLMSSIGFAAPSNAAVLAGSPEVAQVLRLPLGEGEVWVLAGMEPITNNSIDQSDNFRFMLNLLSSPLGTDEQNIDSFIYIDEFHHGVLEPLTGVQRNQWESLKVVAALVALWLCFGVVSRAIRFGPPQAPRNLPPGTTSDFLIAVGRLYEDKKAASLLRNYVFAWSKRTQQQLRMRGSAEESSDPQKLAEYLCDSNIVDAKNQNKLLLSLDTLLNATDHPSPESAAQYRHALLTLEQITSHIYKDSDSTRSHAYE